MKYGINLAEGEHMSNWKFTNTNTSNSFNENNGYINMSEKDRRAIDLLKLLLVSNIISIVSDIVATKATINGIKAISNKYTKNNENILNPNLLALYSIYLGFSSRIIVTKVGLSKAQIAFKDYARGDSSVNLENYKAINISNVIFIIGIIIAMEVAENIRESERLNIFV